MRIMYGAVPVSFLRTFVISVIDLAYFSLDLDMMNLGLCRIAHSLCTKSCIIIKMVCGKGLFLCTLTSTI